MAPRDHQLATAAIRALADLDEFTSPALFPYTVLCADLNIDEEAANHVKPAEDQRYDDDPVVRAERRVREALEERDIARSKLDQLKREHARISKEPPRKKTKTGKGPKSQRLTTKHKEQRKRREKRVERSEAALREARERLADIESGELDDPVEFEALMATEEAFAPLADTELFSRLSYSPDFRTTLRMSVHRVCTRPPRAKHYDDTVSLDRCLYSNFDQVLLRADSNNVWGESKTTTWNLMGLVMPADARARVGIKSAGSTTEVDDTKDVPMTAGLLAHLLKARISSECADTLYRWDEEARQAAKLAVQAKKKELKDPFRKRKLERAKRKLLRTIDPRGEYDDSEYGDLIYHESLSRHRIVMNQPRQQQQLEVSKTVSPALQMIDKTLDKAVLLPFLREVEVMAGALVGAYKRFVKMNNEHEDIDLIRATAKECAAKGDPVSAFLKSSVWKKHGVQRAGPLGIKYIKPKRPEDSKHSEQWCRFFEANVYLELANALSDHIPVCVEVKLQPRPRSIFEPAPSPTSLPSSAPLQLVVPCEAFLFRDECENIDNCVGTCDERTSVKTSDGCITGWWLVRTAVACVAARIRATSNFVLDKNNPREWWLKSGIHWLRSAGVLQRTKSWSSAFAAHRATAEYFSIHKNIWVGATSVKVQIDGCNNCKHKTVCAACGAYWNHKHPRVRFESGTPTGKGWDREAGDWSYRKIGQFFSSLGDDRATAQALLTLLERGVLPTEFTTHSTPFAALLVTLFGVEANKDNTCYLTGILALQGVQRGDYTMREVFADADPSNSCNLAGSLGLFPLASSERSNFYGKRRCLTGRATLGEDEWDEPTMMEAMLDVNPREKSDLMLKKDMVVLADSARRLLGPFASYKSRSRPFGYPTEDAKRLIKTTWTNLLAKYYG